MMPIYGKNLKKNLLQKQLAKYTYCDVKHLGLTFFFYGEVRFDSVCVFERKNDKTYLETFYVYDAKATK